MMDPAAQDNQTPAADNADQNQPETTVENHVPNPPEANQPPTTEPTPQIFHSTEEAPPEESLPTEMPKKSKKKWVILLLFFFLLVALPIATGGLAYAVTYQKISLGQPKLENKIRMLVLSLPFTPKTPEFLLKASALAHQEISKHAFDISFAFSSDAKTEIPIFTNLDFQMVGDVDYSDPDNIKTAFNVSLSKELSADVLKADQMVYFKINKLPAYLNVFVDETALLPLMSRWVAYDTSALETEAREYLEENQTENLATPEEIEASLQEFFDEKILAAITLSEDETKGVPAYKLHFQADAETIDYLFEKLLNELKEQQPDVWEVQPEIDQEEIKASDVITKLDFELWIAKKTYFLHRAVGMIELTTPDSPGYSPKGILPGLTPSDQQKFSLSGVAQFSKFGEPVVIEEPTEYMTEEEFYQIIGEILKENLNFPAFPEPEIIPDETTLLPQEATPSLLPTSPQTI